MTSSLRRDYILCSEIGRGTYGVIRRCYLSDSENKFAAKTIDKSLLSKGSINMKSLELEAIIMQLVGEHRNIVSIYDVYEDDKFVDIVMELCEGGDLYDKLANEGVFNEEKAMMVMVQLMDAISYCHKMNVVHRDIKPENILFDGYGSLRLADFGLAVIMDGSLMSGSFGTPYYVAPEVVKGVEYNEKVDVWSAGVVMYMMLSGVPPFPGKTSREILKMILNGNLMFPTMEFKDVSPEAKDLLRRMICTDASKRFSAEQVLNHSWMTEGRAKVANRT